MPAARLAASWRMRRSPPYHHYWVPANKLSKGERLKTPNGVIVVAGGGSTPKVHDGWMWDLTVPGPHDFYVASGSAAILVHNCPAGPTGASPSDVAAQINASGDPSKVIAIGRTMSRVRGAVQALRAEGIANARWYQAWTNDPFNPDLAMARNLRWIRSKMNQGYTIVDIGPDLSRADRTARSMAWRTPRQVATRLFP